MSGIEGLTNYAGLAPDPTAGKIYLGNIHLGKKRASRDDAPADLTHFRIEVAERWQSRLDAAILRIYGQNPTTLSPVQLLGSTPEICFATCRLERGNDGKRIVRRCDGQQQTMWIDQGIQHGVQRGEAAIPCRGGGKNGGCADCRPNGVLNVILWELFLQTKIYGYFRLETGSIHAIKKIYAALTYFHEMALHVDNLAFALVRIEQPVGWRDGKDRNGKAIQVPIKKWIVNLEPTEETAVRLGGLIASSSAGALAAPVIAAPESALRALASGSGAPVGVNAQLGAGHGNAAPVGIADPQNRPAEAADDPDASDGDFSEELSCASLFVQFDDGDYQYVLRCEGASNFWLTDLAPLADLGYDTSKWQAKGKVVPFNPPLVVVVREEQVIDIRRGE